MTSADSSFCDASMMSLSVDLLVKQDVSSFLLFQTFIINYVCFQKRVCLEAELHSPEHPMEISHTFTASNQQQEQQVSAGCHGGGLV